MARNRMVKPEFCTSEQVVECSTSARLLFVLMWMFCDDAGIHPDSAKRLKMEVFPADDFTTEQVEAWVGELVATGLLERYTVEGQGFLRVTGWHHQKIDRPNFRYPKPIDRQPVDDDSTSTRRGLVERSPLKRKEEKLSKEDSLVAPQPDGDHSSDPPPEPPPTRPRSKANEHPAFAEFWSAYPSRGQATNPRKPAAEKFARIVAAGEDPAEIIRGVAGYAAYCRKSGKLGLETVKQAVTFLTQEVWKQYAAGQQAETPAAVEERRKAWGHIPVLVAGTPEALAAYDAD
jgi:hypothetical protein